MLLVMCMLMVVMVVMVLMLIWMLRLMTAVGGRGDGAGALRQESRAG